jgi:hypothetical protein
MNFNPTPYSRKDGDTTTSAARVVLANTLVTEPYDYVSLAQATLTDTWTFKKGGAGGTLVATVTITFTDATKGTISTVAKT